MKAVIFDLDGVLCSTDDFHYLAWKQLADREGIPFDRQISNQLRGVSRMASLEIILRKASKAYTDEEKEEMANFKNEVYKSFLTTMGPKDLTKDVAFTLQTLKSRGFQIAIGSSSKNTKTILKQLGIIDIFDAISDGTNITHSKPDPEVFLKAAEMLGLEPRDCCVVEDAYSGIDAAKAGGFTALAIGDAAKYEKADYVLTKLSDLLAIVKEPDEE